MMDADSATELILLNLISLYDSRLSFMFDKLMCKVEKTLAFPHYQRSFVILPLLTLVNMQLERHLAVATSHTDSYLVMLI